MNEWKFTWAYPKPLKFQFLLNICCPVFIFFDQSLPGSTLPGIMPMTLYVDRRTFLLNTSSFTFLGRKEGKKQEYQWQISSSVRTGLHQVFSGLYDSLLKYLVSKDCQSEKCFMHETILRAFLRLFIQTMDYFFLFPCGHKSYSFLASFQNKTAFRNAIFLC